MGEGSSLWDNNWDKHSVEEALKSNCTLRVISLLRKYFLKGRRILEGGCGLGQYVVYFKNSVYHIFGLYFSKKGLKKVSSFMNDLPLITGDVGLLPVKDNSFSAYYSGGVVEHFESGPEEAIKEAHRVLDKKDGLLLISVPYVNLLRKFKVFFMILKTLRGFKKPEVNKNISYEDFESGLILVDGHKKTKSPFRDKEFMQYSYGKKEFSDILKKCGFKVICCEGYSLEWGLMDLKWFRELINKKKVSSGSDKSCAENIDRKGMLNKLRDVVNVFYKFVFLEYPTNNYLFKMLRAICRPIFANMILFVCKA